MSHLNVFDILFSFGILQLCTSAIVSRSITFNDTTQFQDISLYNFADGLNKTYEFVVTARTGKMVSLYLFQNDKEMQYKIDAYDVTDDRTLQLNLSMQPTTHLLLTPIAVTTTEQNMFIRVTAVKTSNNFSDFQAMVTDYSPQEDCKFPGLSVNIKANYSASYLLHQNTVSSCIYVIHANDPTNQRSVLQKIFPNISGLGLDTVTVFKGLQMDNDHNLKTTKQMTSLWAYDSYLTIVPKKTMGINFGWDNTVYRDNTNTLNLQLPVVNGIENVLMTMDYLREPSPNFGILQSSKITLKVISPATKVQVNYSKLGTTGSITVTPFANGHSRQPITYYGAKLIPFTATYESEEVELLYINLGADNNDSGFYGTYKDASKNMTSTTTTTVRPIQTTTKVAGNVVYSICCLIFMSLLVLV